MIDFRHRVRLHYLALRAFQSRFHLPHRRQDGRIKSFDVPLLLSCVVSRALRCAERFCRLRPAHTNSTQSHVWTHASRATPAAEIPRQAKRHVGLVCRERTKGEIVQAPSVSKVDHWSSDSSFPCAGVKKLSRTKSATSRPRRCPVVRSNRKCCPPKIRLNVASSAAAEMLVKDRCTPGRTSDVTLNSAW